MSCVCNQPPSQSLSEFVASLRYPWVSHGARSTISPLALSSDGTMPPFPSITFRSTSAKGLPVRTRRSACSSMPSFISAVLSWLTGSTGQDSERP